jgi:hypothetical protein
MIHQYHFWVYSQKNQKQSLKEILHTHIYSGVIHSRQEVEATQGSISK